MTGENEQAINPRTQGALICQMISSFGAAICGFVAAYEAFNMRPVFWWAIGAGVSVLIGFIGKRASASDGLAMQEHDSSRLRASLLERVVLVLLLLVSSGAIVTSILAQTQTGYLGFMGGGIGAFLIAVLLHAMQQRARWQFRHGGGLGWRILFVAGWMLCGLMALALQFIIPEFAAVLDSFGADLPLATKLVGMLVPWLLLAPIGIGLVWMYWPRPASRLKAAVIAGWVGTALMLMAVATMYLPIWQMSQAA